jgi:hypothetical protein
VKAGSSNLRFMQVDTSIIACAVEAFVDTKFLKMRFLISTIRLMKVYWMFSVSSSRFDSTFVN